jgi:hypothetical protein
MAAPRPTTPSVFLRSPQNFQGCPENSPSAGSHCSTMPPPSLSGLHAGPGSLSCRTASRLPDWSQASCDLNRRGSRRPGRSRPPGCGARLRRSFSTQRAVHVGGSWVISLIGLMPPSTLETWVRACSLGTGGQFCRQIVGIDASAIIGIDVDERRYLSHGPAAAREAGCCGAPGTEIRISSPAWCWRFPNSTPTC